MPAPDAEPIETFPFLRPREGRAGEALMDRYPTVESLGDRVVAQHDGNKRFWVVPNGERLRAEIARARAEADAPRRARRVDRNSSAAYLREVVFAGQPQKVRFDVDSVPVAREDRVLAAVTEAFTEAFYATYHDVAIEMGVAPLFAFASSRGPAAGAADAAETSSWHVVVHNLAFACGAEVDALARATAQALPPECARYVDMGIYSDHRSRTLRLLGCAKVDAPKRVKRLDNARSDAVGDDWTAMLLTDTAHLAAMPRRLAPARGEQMQRQVTQIPRPVVEAVLGAFPGLLDGLRLGRLVPMERTRAGARPHNEVASVLCRFDREAPSHCRVCARRHESDTPYLLVSALRRQGLYATADEGTRMYRATLGCHRARGTYVQLGAAEAPSALVADAPEAAADAAAAGWRERVAALVETAAGARLPMDPSTLDPLAEIDRWDRYCEPDLRPFDLAGPTRTLFVSADLMMGKTARLCDLLEQGYPLEPEDALDRKRIVVVSCRRSFTQDLLRRLEPQGFVSYEALPAGRPITASRVIVQVESLGRLDLRDGPPDLVVADEATSVVLQLCSPHVRAPQIVIEIFRFLLEAAGRVLLMDAFLGDQVFSVVREARGLAGAAVHESLWSRGHELGKRMELARSPADWLAALRASLGAGKRVAVLTNSRQAAMKYALAVEEWWQRDLPAGAPGRHPLRLQLISGADTEVAKQAFFADVDAAVRDLDVLISTPVMTAGVSINEPIFAEVFGHFIGESCCAETCMQMLGRVRRPAEGRFVVLTQNCFSAPDSVPCTPAELLAEIGRRDANLLRLSQQYGDIDRAFQLRLEGGRARLAPLKSFAATVWLANAAMTNRSKKDFSGRFAWLAAGTGIAIAPLAAAPAPARAAVMQAAAAAGRAARLAEGAAVWGAAEITGEAAEELRARRRDLDEDERLALLQADLRRGLALSGPAFRALANQWAGGPAAFVAAVRPPKLRRHFATLALVCSLPLPEGRVGRELAKRAALQLLDGRDHAARTADFERFDLAVLDADARHRTVTLLASLERFLRAIGFASVTSPSPVTVERVCAHLRLAPQRVAAFAADLARSLSASGRDAHWYTRLVARAVESDGASVDAREALRQLFELALSGLNLAFGAKLWQFPGDVLRIQHHPMFHVPAAVPVRRDEYDPTAPALALPAPAPQKIPVPVRAQLSPAWGGYVQIK